MLETCGSGLPERLPTLWRKPIHKRRGSSKTEGQEVARELPKVTTCNLDSAVWGVSYPCLHPSFSVIWVSTFHLWWGQLLQGFCHLQSRVLTSIGITCNKQRPSQTDLCIQGVYRDNLGTYIGIEKSGVQLNLVGPWDHGATPLVIFPSLSLWGLMASTLIPSGFLCSSLLFPSVD